MILGHERQVKYLEKAMERGRLAHAYLFYGPEHVGKFTLAKSIAGKLNCPHPVILDTKNTLLSKKEERKKIPIQDIQELKRLFALAAPGAEWRIAIINEAQNLSDEAANAFLKLLEEPGQRTLFLLITEDRESLLPTIVSRAMPLGFYPVSDTILREFLADKGIHGASADDYLKYAAGKPGILMKFLDDPKHFERIKRLDLAVREGIRGNTAEALCLSERLAEKEELLPQVVMIAFRAAREELLKTPFGGKVLHYKNAERIASLLSTNINTRLALDALFLELRLLYS